MTSQLSFESPVRDAVRIKVIQHSTGEDSQSCKFSVDPELTTYSVLRNLIARAFDIKGDFQIRYLAKDDRVEDAFWLDILSDFDMKLAFQKSDPHLLVRVDLIKSHDVFNVPNIDLTKLSLPDLPKNNYTVKLPGIFKEKIEKTLSLVQKALNWNEEGFDDCRPPRHPLTDSEFQGLLDPLGTLMQPHNLRLGVYMGGVEPALRKVVWKHILNVYPSGLTGKERYDYMKKKVQEYEALRYTWLDYLQQSEKVSEEVSYVTNMIKKDVLRTDRNHPFFSGPDDNANVNSLYNILTTYALNHPSVGYCQGMSDLASPLLVTMNNEAQAYVCFCALMTRLHSNFHIDGDAMTLKFQHLTDALIFYDPEFFQYLRLHQADDLLFCYRWLLLELKREFVFDDAQFMLEVLWSSLPPDPPEESLSLTEVVFSPKKEEEIPNVPSTPRQNHYANVCALRRQRSAVSDRSVECLAALLNRKAISADHDGKKLSRTWSQPIDPSVLKNDTVNSFNNSTEQKVNVQEIKEELNSPDDSPGRAVRRIKNLREFQKLIKLKDSDTDNSNPSSPIKEEKKIQIKTKEQSFLSAENRAKRCFSDSDTDAAVMPSYDGGDVDVWQNPVATLSPDDDETLQIICNEEQPTKICQIIQKSTQDNSKNQTTNIKGKEYGSVMATSVTSCEEVTETIGWQVTVSGSRSAPTLPPPEDFGGGNPFLMFLCMTILLQHRDYIMDNNMDHNELAMHFDKMVRGHNVHKVLGHARRMLQAYKSHFDRTPDKISPSVSNHSC